MEARRSQSSTDGRRRRLLASQDSTDLLAEFQALAPRASSTVAPRITVVSPDRQILHRMVSRQLWKHGLMILAVVFLAGAAVWIEFCQPLVLHEIAATNQLRVSKGLAGMLLVIAGQLSLMIGWVRSHSAVDFSGRYRCWKWLAACLASIGCLWITNTQDVLPQLTEAVAEPLIGSISAARRTLVIVPIAGLSIWVLSRVWPDMGRNRPSQILFAVSVVTAVARLLMSYGATQNSFEPSIQDGTLLVSAGLAVSSLLLHTRFVLYISKDPPERTAAATTEAGQTGGQPSPGPTEADDRTETIPKDQSVSTEPDHTATIEHRHFTEGDVSPDVTSRDLTRSGSTKAASGPRQTRQSRSKRRKRRAA